MQVRKKVEGRLIPPKDFVDQYFRARENANRLKEIFASNVRLDLLLKNVDGTNKLCKIGVDKIDNHIPEEYTRQDIEDFINQREGNIC